MRRLERAVGCVVTSPWAHECAKDVLRALINPANEALIGTARPYFPRGGPVPPRPPPGLEATSRGWGGLDAGPNMLYPAQAVDGLVHQYGGRALKDALAAFPVLEERRDAEPVRCRTGSAVLTPSPPSLPFDVLAHTPPPFWPPSAAAATGDDLPASCEDQLLACFTSALDAVSLEAAARGKEHAWVATPLLGAGARGAPAEVAARVLVRAYCEAPLRTPNMVLRVVLNDSESARAVQQAAEAQGVGLA